MNDHHHPHTSDAHRKQQASQRDSLSPTEQYVLTHYRHGALDSKKAYQRFVAKTGMRRHFRLLPWVASVAALLIFGFLGAALYFREPTTILTADTSYETYLLQDGSKVILAPHSSLSWKGEYRRQVSIAGKAYIEVAHDKKQPFAVTDHDYIVRDIGTKFMVDETSNGALVYVTEGEVYFASTAAKAQGVRLTPSQAATLSFHSKRLQRMSSPPADLTTWATGQFHFDNTPLSDVLKVLSAHYHVQLTSDKTSPKLTGDFDVTSLDELILLINKTLNVRISRP